MNNRAAIRRSLALLTTAERRRLRMMVALQTLTPLLDLIGVLLIGMVVALGTAQDGPLPAAVAGALSAPGLASLEPLSAAGVLAALAAAVLVAKSLASLWISRRVTRFLAGCSSRVSAQLSGDFLDQPLLAVRERSSQRNAFALTTGLTAAVLALLGATVAVWAEVALLVILGGALLLIDPVITVTAVVYLVAVSLVLHRLIAQWSSRASSSFAEAEIGGITTVQDAIATYRETAVAARIEFYRDRLADGRAAAANAQADQAFAQSIPRFGMEIALVIGAVLLVGGLVMTTDTATALNTLALFLAAASRVTPALMRLNLGRLMVTTASGVAGPAFELIDALPRGAAAGTTRATAPVAPVEQAPEVVTLPDDESPAVVIDHVSFTYPGAGHPTIADITLTVPVGGSLVIVGPTGSGKSTLNDLILGILAPDSGRILIGGRTPAAAIRRRPGSISYVPQHVALVSGTVRENVALALPHDQVDDDRIRAVLQQVDLAGLLVDERNGLDTWIGEEGVRLSGGQQQRLGLARALYPRPQLLVLDEATSALDADTERTITDALAALPASVTTVTVAHRLSTVRLADQVAYLDRGRLLAVGSFTDVRAAVPQFDHQAQLLGL